MDPLQVKYTGRDAGREYLRLMFAEMEENSRYQVTDRIERRNLRHRLQGARVNPAPASKRGHED